MGEKLSPAAVKSMRYIKRFATFRGCPVQISGDRSAHLVSACRALVRRGLATEGPKTGHFGLTPAGYSALESQP